MTAAGEGRLDPAADAKVLCVTGARPNFMKIAPIVAAQRQGASQITACLVHTGPHYYNDMNERFCAQLGIPSPDHSLGQGSNILTGGRDTARRRRCTRSRPQGRARAGTLGRSRGRADRG